MNKSSSPASQPCSREPEAFCGIDVGAETLAVAVQPDQHREFPNTSSGHQQLIVWLRRFGFTRVSLEATGIYWLDLGLALDAAADIECAVLNPKSAHNFAKTLGQRSKTDKLDAKSLAEYSRRMNFVAWRRPSPEALQLRSLSRHIESLTIERVRDSNRLHAAEATTSTPRCVLQDLRRCLKAIDKRIRDLRRAAVTLVRTDQHLHHQFQLLIAMPGIAEVSAMHLLENWLRCRTACRCVSGSLTAASIPPTVPIVTPTSTNPSRCSFTTTTATEPSPRSRWAKAWGLPSRTPPFSSPTTTHPTSCFV